MLGTMVALPGVLRTWHGVKDAKDRYTRVRRIFFTPLGYYIGDYKSFPSGQAIVIVWEHERLGLPNIFIT